VATLDQSAELGELDLGFAALGGTPASSVAVRRPTLTVTANGNTLDNVFGAHLTFGWDQLASTASITLAARPEIDDVPYNCTVTVTCGVDQVVKRFEGRLREWDYSFYPRAVVLHAAGTLSLLEEFEQKLDTVGDDEGAPGLELEPLLGIPLGSGGGTLKEIISAVLDDVGVTYTAGLLADPTHEYGLEAPEEFTWRQGETAAGYVNRLCEASEGYRLFNSADGDVYLAQIKGRPRGSTDLAFTAGVDIFESSRANRSITQTRNSVRVNGLDYGDGDGPVTYLLESSNDIQTVAGSHLFTVSSSLIETEDWAETMANFWSGEMNREIVQVTLHTFRDDVIGPAQTHLVDALDRLGTGEPLWVKRVEIDVSGGEFSQTMTYLGGGLPDDYAGPSWV
jgi:hypothetical protein